MKAARLLGLQWTRGVFCLGREDLVRVVEQLEAVLDIAEVFHLLHEQIACGLEDRREIGQDLAPTEEHASRLRVELSTVAPRLLIPVDVLDVLPVGDAVLEGAVGATGPEHVDAVVC